MRTAPFRQAMPRNHAPALVLTGSIDAASIETVDLESVLSPPAIRFEHRMYRAPLDLTADVFRYRVLPGGSIVALRDEARHCFSSTHRRRR